MSSPQDACRSLVIGPWHWRFGRGPTAGDRYTLVALSPTDLAANTTLLEHATLDGARYTCHEWGGAMLGHGRLTGPPLADLRAAGDLAAGPTGQHAWTPLFLLGRRGPQLVTHSQIRLGDTDALFLRTGTTTTPRSNNYSGAPDADIQHAVDLNYAHRTFLTNHQCCFTKFWPDEEIEHKLTLTGPVDILAVAAFFRDLVWTPAFSGYIWEYRNEFEQWQFDNYLYEITRPAEEGGYISFIPDSLGTATVKRKWFTRDTVRRRETRWRSVPLHGPADYARHVDQLGLETTYRGSFRRTRFDVNYECLATGNIHSIMFDRCQPLEHDGAALYQVEIEYLRSRTLDPNAADHVDDELEYLLRQTKHQLTALGITYTEGPLSKLTYLRTLANSRT